jgi:chitodextrinase
MGKIRTGATCSTAQRFVRRLLVVLLIMSIPLGQAAISGASEARPGSPPGADAGRAAHAGAPLGPAVRVSGNYRIFHRDDFANPSRDVLRYELVTPDGDVLSVHGSGFSHVSPGSSVSVAGHLAGDDLFVGGPSGTEITVTRAATAQASVGQLNTAVIAVNFSNSSTSIDVAALRALFQGSPGSDVVSYFTEASYGKMQLAPSFFGPYRLAEASQAGCGNLNVPELLQLADSDIDFTRFSRLVYVANCTGYGASATSAGQVSTPDGTITAAQILADANTALSVYTHVHELSHTLGSFNMHAAIDVCLPDAFTPPSRFDKACDVAEYGDPFDVLGGGRYHHVSQLDPRHKSTAGWLSPSQFPSVTTSGTYTLAPYENGTGTVALDIPRGGTGTSFTVEYRRPIGFDAWIGSDCGACDVSQGASIRLAGFNVTGSGGGSDTQLLDNTPGTIVDPTFYYPVDDVLDGALLPGHSFTDPETGIRIAAVSVGAQGLTVQVTVPSQACVHGAPGVTAPGPSTQTASAGQAKTYTFTLTNTDSAGCGSNTFRFFRNTTYGDLTVTGTPDYVVLAAGASTSVTVSIISKTTTVDGEYDYPSGLGRVFSNSLGNYVATVPAVTYRVTSPADATAPAAPPSPAATALGSATIGVSWSPSTDNMGVAGYVIERDGSIFTSQTPWFLDTNLSPRTTYSYAIRAFDRKDNESAPATVSVTTPAATDSTQPTVPTVRATATDRSVSLSWSGATDNVGVAYYRVVPCIATCWLPASARSLTATGLPTRTRYDIQVIPVDGDGNFSSPVPYPVSTGALGDSPPTRPDLLVSPSGTAARTELTWSPSTDDRGVTGYDVYRNNRIVTRVASTSYSDPVGGNHEYYVQAVDGEGSISAPSPRVWFLAPTSLTGDASPPSASIQSPGEGSTVSGTVQVTAPASDDVAVTKVELYVDGTLVATSSADPFSFQWDTTRFPDGIHWVYARAYDAARNYGTAEFPSLTVDNGGGGDRTPPTVSITAPSDGSTVSGQVNVTADASDDVSMDRVEFAVDGSVQSTATSPPYAFGWDTAGAAIGPHTISARAFDAAGNSTATSASVTVSASDADTVPPSTPEDLAGSMGHSVDLSWETSTDDTAVAGYSIVRDGTEIAQATGTIYADEDVVRGETYSYQVVAVDEAGNRSDPSNTATITVPLADEQPPAPPRVAAMAISDSRVALSWSIGQGDVGIAGYDVYRNGAIVGSTRKRSFVELDVSGSVTYRVRSRDAAGNSSAGSMPVLLTVPSVSGVRRLGALVVSDGDPLADVRVRTRIGGSLVSFFTNSVGAFRVRDIPAGVYQLTVSRWGYVAQVLTVRVAASGMTARRVILSRA